MKKTFVLFLSLAFGFQAFSQIRSSSEHPSSVMPSMSSSQEAISKSQPSYIPSSSKAVIFSETFGGGFPATWTKTNQGGALNAGWKWSSVSPLGAYTNSPGSTVHMDSIKSPSAGNGFMLLNMDSINSNWANPNNPVIASNYSKIDASITTPTIDLSGHPNVHLTFYHFFRCFTGYKLMVYFSKDNGTTWTDSVDVGHNVAVNASSQNALFERISITNYVGGQANVKIKFRAYGTSHYFWMIDDVTVEDAANNFVEWGRMWFFNGYSKIPSGHTFVTTAYADLYNRGGNVQHNVKLHARELNSNTDFVGTNKDSLVIGGNDTLAAIDFFNINANGTYKFNFYFNSDEIVKNQRLDTLKTVVGDTVFAKDNDYFSSKNIWAGSGSSGMQAFELGSEYVMGKNSQATGVQFRIFSTSLGATLKVKLYKNMSTLIAESNYYQTTTSDEPTSYGYNKPTIYLPFTSNPMLDKDTTYLAVVECYGGTDTVAFALGGDFPQPDANWFLREAGETLWTWYTNDVSNVPQIRLIVDGTPVSIGVQENTENNFILNPAFPNPASTETMINYELKKSAKVNFKLTDLTGRIVMNLNKGIQEAGQHNMKLDVSQLAAGTYFYTLTAGENQKTLKLIVR